MVNNKCAIWSDFDAIHTSINGSDSYCIESTRAGGKYEISSEVAELIGELEDSKKVRLTTWLVDQRLQGVYQPKVTEEIIDYIKTKRPLSVPERADRLLRFIANKTEKTGNSVSFHTLEDAGNSNVQKRRLKEIQNTHLAFAWSESTDWEEIDYFLEYMTMTKKGWLKNGAYGEDPKYNDDNTIKVTVTIDGYSRIGDLETEIDSVQAFVAMWFDDEMKKVYEEGIKPAIEDAGYKSVRIDLKPDANKLDDEIIGEIRRSLFLIADMTHGKCGARGGVYYEAGFAYGLGKPVIYTCCGDMIGKVHFDTRQYAHILWEEEKLGELRKKLCDRILARIGEGPEMGTTNPAENDSA